MRIFKELNYETIAAEIFNMIIGVRVFDTSLSPVTFDESNTTPSLKYELGGVVRTIDFRCGYVFVNNPSDDLENVVERIVVALNALETRYVINSTHRHYNTKLGVIQAGPICTKFVAGSNTRYITSRKTNTNNITVSVDSIPKKAFSNFNIIVTNERIPIEYDKSYYTQEKVNKTLASIFIDSGNIFDFANNTLIKTVTNDNFRNKADEKFANILVNTKHTNPIKFGFVKLRWYHLNNEWYDDMDVCDGFTLNGINGAFDINKSTQCTACHGIMIDFGIARIIGGKLMKSLVCDRCYEDIYYNCSNEHVKFIKIPSQYTFDQYVRDNHPAQYHDLLISIGQGKLTPQGCGYVVDGKYFICHFTDMFDAMSDTNLPIFTFKLRN